MKGGGGLGPCRLSEGKDLQAESGLLNELGCLLLGDLPSSARDSLAGINLGAVPRRRYLADRVIHGV